VIALHSPDALLETGLRVCPPEKRRDSDAVLSRAVRSLQSGLLRKNREKRATFAYFGGKNRGISLQLRLAGGEIGIQTFVTFVWSPKSRRVRNIPGTPLGRISTRPSSAYSLRCPRPACSRRSAATSASMSSQVL
jgi:hypothetical protein